MEFSIKPVAYMRNERKTIEDDYWGTVTSTIELAPEFKEDALRGLEDFSHLEVIFYFDQVPDEKMEYEARHPRHNKDYPKVCIFTKGGKNRTNKLGLTTVELITVNKRSLVVKGLDAIDGTPVLDIKPVLVEFLPQEKVKQPEWSTMVMKSIGRNEHALFQATFFE